MSVLDTIKEHPYIVVGGVGAVAVLYLYSGSSSSTTAAASTAQTSANAVALQSAALQASVQNSANQIGLTESTQNDQANLDLAGIQSSTVEYQQNLEAEVALSQIGAGVQTTQIAADTTNTANTLNAQVAENNNLTTQNIAQINANENTTDTADLVSVLSQQIAGTTEVNEQLAQNQKPQSLLQQIFG